MRVWKFFKVVLIIGTIGIIGLSILAILSMLEEMYRTESLYRLDFFFILLPAADMVFGTISLLFELKTFNLVNKNEIVLNTKFTNMNIISTYLWIGLVVFSCLVFAFAVLITFLLITEPPNEQLDCILIGGMTIIIYLMSFGIPREAWLMRKRIHLLKRETMDNLEEIGRS